MHFRTLPPEPHLFSVTFDSLLSPLSTIPQDCSRHFLDNFRFALPCFIQMHNRVSHLAQMRFGMHVAFDIQRWHESGKVIYIMAVLAKRGCCNLTLCRQAHVLDQEVPMRTRKRD